MDMNGRNSSNNGNSNGRNSSNYGNGLPPANLELNLGLDSLDHQQVPLSLINGRPAVGLSARHTINGNLQAHLIHQPNYFMRNPTRNPVAITRALNQSFTHFSTMPSPPLIQTSPAMTWPPPQQQQQEICEYQYPIPESDFLSMGGFSTGPPVPYFLELQQGQIYNHQIMNHNYNARASTAATMGYLTPLDILNSQSRPIQSTAPAATRPSSSNVQIYQQRSITTGRRRRNLDQVIQSLINRQNQEQSVSWIGEEIDHEAGLNEGEIMMSVERLIHCPSFVMSEHEGEACAICQEEFKQGDDDICKLRCNHIYHFECIKAWLMQRNFCPICRAPAMYF
ncbi:uncharacterized RING finger protein P32A8.03c-like [Impatiens glandulifera]|uniref:uncharacterized RING finger protein P32A8.03c-like n=1 Tax=Impatiens glandulifera TaxID=253017 RepID=UPI001FB11D28|nr:uncharacterized RING finger protein P32A8.03c-like [Impatiens glandulifera]